ncbi:ankyrin repeat protein [Streptacidiphilus sp. MAP12-16]|uniref:ankyrin repeat domain-containing protein n=1 Tax=Streptacidiphilus sp. MAP12-16 TaxID=3156300 RepID=UPI003514A22A
MGTSDAIRPTDNVMSSAEIAVNNLDLDALRQFLDTGGDVNDRAWEGWTLLMSAIDSEACLADDGQPLRVECTALLLARGADTGLVKHDGSTALEIADERGHWLAAELIRAWDASSRA